MKKMRVILTVLLSIALLTFLLWPVSVITINAQSGQRVQQKIGADERVILYFLHSYYHVPQYEYYRHEGNQLVLDEIRFGDLQAANYYDPFRTYTLNEETGYYELKNIGYRIDAHRFAMAHGTDYSISVGSHTYDLNKTFPDASSIETTVQVTPRIIYYYWRLFK